MAQAFASRGIGHAEDDRSMRICIRWRICSLLGQFSMACFRAWYCWGDSATGDGFGPDFASPLVTGVTRSRASSMDITVTDPAESRQSGAQPGVLDFDGSAGGLHPRKSVSWMSNKAVYIPLYEHTVLSGLPVSLCRPNAPRLSSLATCFFVPTGAVLGNLSARPLAGRRTARPQQSGTRVQPAADLPVLSLATAHAADGLSRSRASGASVVPVERPRPGPRGHQCLLPGPIAPARERLEAGVGSSGNVCRATRGRRRATGRPTGQVVDSTTVRLPDTRANQKRYPQSPYQKPRCGFPLRRGRRHGRLDRRAVEPISRALDLARQSQGTDRRHGGLHVSGCIDVAWVARIPCRKRSTSRFHRSPARLRAAWPRFYATSPPAAPSRFTTISTICPKWPPGLSDPAARLGDAGRRARSSFDAGRGCPFHVASALSSMSRAASRATARPTTSRRSCVPMRRSGLPGFLSPTTISPQPQLGTPF